MTNNQATLHKLDQMRLHGMARALRTSLDSQVQWTADELLTHLVDAEWDDRHERRLQRLLKAARFRYPAAIEEVDFSLRRNLDRNQLLRLADCRWVQHHQDLIITGKCGSGKSFLASALGHQACLRGFRVGYHASSRLFGELRLAKADGSYVRELEKISKQALLIIDLSRPCDYPDARKRWSWAALWRRTLAAGHGAAGRDNHRPSRKASSRSGGRNRPTLVVGGVVRASARSLILMSACK